MSHQPSSRGVPEDISRIRSELATRYAIALRAGLTPALRKAPSLSGIFLPEVFPEYLGAPVRVMLVGKETKGWFKGFSDVSDGGLDAYTQQAMAEWKRVAEIPPRKSKFGQFRRHLDKALSERAERPVRHHWANLFCLDHAKGSPVHLEEQHFKAIRSLSKELLRIQLDVLRPDVLLFTTGIGTTSYDRHMADMLDITARNTDMTPAPPGSLRRFLANGICSIRTAHPRALTKTDRLATLAEILAFNRSTFATPEGSAQ